MEVVAEDDEDQEQTRRKGDEDVWKGFELPFPVATFEDVKLRAYLTPDNTAEFLWVRIHDHCGIGQNPSRLLKLNMASIQQDLHHCQVPEQEMHYRGADERKDIVQSADNSLWKDHTLEPRCMLVMLMWVMKNRALPSECKVKALNLLLTMAQISFQFVADRKESIQAMIIGKDGRLYSQELVFAPLTSLCSSSWQSLLSHCPAALKLWSNLSKKTWMQRCITSTLGNASLCDVIFFTTYIFAHPKEVLAGQNLFLAFAIQFLPSLVCSLGGWLQEVTQHKAKEALKPLPTLKGKAGHARKICDPVNRLILLFKLRKQKLHRLTIAETHDDDLGNARSRMLWFEAYIDTLLHAAALESAFKGSRQICIAWDPSSYGGKDVNVAVCYDTLKGVAGYLLNQQMAHIRVSEISSELVQFAKGRKLTRIEGYREVKAFSAAMQSINLSLMDFVAPPVLHCRPLQPHELRLKQPDGSFSIFNENTGEIQPEIGEGVNLQEVSCLVSVSDQGPNNTAAMNYVMFSNNSLMVWALWDCYHRTWNDLKASFKKSACRAWKVILEVTLLCNMSYGPYGTGQWHYKKQSYLQQFLETHSHLDAAWGEIMPLICLERKMEEPRTEEDSARLFKSLAHVENFHRKGPLVKLARWFSIFQSLEFFEGDLLATKFIIQEQHQGKGQGEDSEPEEDKPLPDTEDYKKELNELKKRKGTWKLAPSLVTTRTIAIRDCIMTIGKASWLHHSTRAKRVLSPLQVAEFHVSCAANDFWKSELVDMMHNSLWDTSCLKHLDPKYIADDHALLWHADLLKNLLEARAMSLSVLHCMPPSLYSHLLSHDVGVARKAHNLALQHWQILLEAEEAHNAGAEVLPLHHMHWRLNPLMRTLLMAFEQDDTKHAFLTPDSASLRLQTILTQTLGDSRMIENAHQHGRDLIRSAKSNTFSNCSIMANTLRSGALEERKVQVVKPTPGLKATSSTWSETQKAPLRQKLHSKHHTLPLHIQKLMQPKGKNNTWQSPAPGSLFQSVAATQWLFEYWSKKDETYSQVAVNDAFLSCLVCVGAFVAHQPTSLLIRVVAVAEFSFLGWVARVHKQDDVGYYVCKAARECLQWFHVTNLDEWLAVPTEAAMVKFCGPVGWVKTGDAMPLETGACMFGLDLTATQLKRLIPWVGGERVRGNPAKRVLEETFISLVVPDHMQDQAMALLKSKVKDKEVDDDIDSNFSEVISELGQDDANTQDLKQYKAKKREVKLKRKLAVKDEELLKGKKKPKSKAKAKAKAKQAPNKRKGLFRNRVAKRMMMKEEDAQQGKQQTEDEQAQEPQEVQEQPQAQEPQVPPPPVPLPPPPPPDDDELPEPASSSGVRPPKRELPEPASSVRASRAKKHSSPEEILCPLWPPGCYIGISYADHRFTSRFPVGEEQGFEKLTGAAKQVNLSRTFVTKHTWQVALSLVHEHCWKKWQTVKQYFPLSKGQSEQTPGHIPDHILTALKPIIDDLPPVTRYS